MKKMFLSFVVGSFLAGFSVNAAAPTESGSVTAAEPVGGGARATQIAGYITDDDYPPSAIRAEESGTSVARIVIDAEGKVTDCVAAGSNSASLDLVTCKLIRERFLFKPARDAKGITIAETRTQRITWKLPGMRMTETPQPRRQTMSFTVEKDGSVSDCKSADTGAPGPSIPCPVYVPPVLDAKGNPVAKRVQFINEVIVTDKK